MGGCASRPKESNVDKQPSENHTRHMKMPMEVAADPIIENNADVKTTNEDKPSLDASEPKQDTPKFDGELPEVEQDIATSGLVADQTSESSGSEKVSEAENPTHVVETPDAEPALETQKAEAEGEGELSKPESVKKQGG